MNESINKKQLLLEGNDQFSDNTASLHYMSFKYTDFAFAYLYYLNRVILCIYMIFYLQMLKKD